MRITGPPLWSSGQSSWLRIQRSGFDPIDSTVSGLEIILKWRGIWVLLWVVVPDMLTSWRYDLQIIQVEVVVISSSVLSQMHRVHFPAYEQYEVCCSFFVPGMMSSDLMCDRSVVTRNFEVGSAEYVSAAFYWLFPHELWNS
jgi:hypothetical protein